MPGNNFCQSLSLSTAGNLQQKCELFAQVQREVCQRTERSWKGRGAWIVLQVVSASGECSLVLCWTQNCKSCNLCALRLRTASAISTNCLIYDQSGVQLYTCIVYVYCIRVCAVCTNFSNHTKPDSAEILIIVCEAAHNQ